MSPSSERQRAVPWPCTSQEVSMAGVFRMNPKEPRTLNTPGSTLAEVSVIERTVALNSYFQKFSLLDLCQIHMRKEVWKWKSSLSLYMYTYICLYIKWRRKKLRGCKVL